MNIEQNKATKVARVVVFLLVAGIVWGGTRYLFAEQNTTNLTRESYLRIAQERCVKEVLANTEASEAVAVPLCQCLSDKIYGPMSVNEMREFDEKYDGAETLPSQYDDDIVACARIAE